MGLNSSAPCCCKTTCIFTLYMGNIDQKKNKMTSTRDCMFPDLILYSCETSADMDTKDETE